MIYIIKKKSPTNKIKINTGSVKLKNITLGLKKKILLPEITIKILNTKDNIKDISIDIFM